MSIELLHGDCSLLLPEVLKRAENPVIITDPPFNVGYHYGQYKDNKKEDEYYEWLEVLLKNCPFVVIHYTESLFRLAFQMGVLPEKVVAWVYNSNTKRQYRSIGFFGIKPDFSKVKQPYKNPNDSRIKKRIEMGQEGASLYDWWNINQIKNVSKEKNGFGHPCIMPLEVMENIVGILPEDITVIDPFMGSGTTGVACKHLNRNFVGIELDFNYFMIASERIKNG